MARRIDLVEVVEFQDKQNLYQRCKVVPKVMAEWQEENDSKHALVGVVSKKHQRIGCREKKHLEIGPPSISVEILEEKSDKTFLFTCFGAGYTENIDSCAEVGNYIVIQNPVLYKKRWLKGEDVFRDPTKWHGYEVIAGSGNFNMNGSTKLFIGKKVATPTKKSSVSTIAPRKSPRLMGSPGMAVAPTPEKAVAGPSSAKPIAGNKTKVDVPKTRRKYTELKDCTSTTKGSNRYNTWAVVTRIVKEPRPTKGLRYMSQVYIQDPTFPGSFGFPDYQFSILSGKEEDFPNLKVGSVVRIHNMIIELFNGYLTGRVYEGAMVTAIHGCVGDPMNPECSAAKFSFCQEDVEKVKELREWWIGVQRQDSLGLSQGFTVGPGDSEPDPELDQLLANLNTPNMWQDSQPKDPAFPNSSVFENMSSGPKASNPSAASDGRSHGASSQDMSALRESNNSVFERNEPHLGDGEASKASSKPASGSLDLSALRKDSCPSSVAYGLEELNLVLEEEEETNENIQRFVQDELLRVQNGHASNDREMLSPAGSQQSVAMSQHTKDKFLTASEATEEETFSTAPSSPETLPIIPLSEVTSFEGQRCQILVKVLEINPEITNLMNLISYYCTKCFQFERKRKCCVRCNLMYTPLLSMNFQVTDESYETIARIFVSGSEAAKLLGCTEEEFMESAEIRDEARKKLLSLKESFELMTINVVQRQYYLVVNQVK